MNAIREALKKFIEAYRDRPCLWDPDNPSYTFKQGRLEALNDLLDIYKNIDTEADLSTVRRKLNTIRTVYNKEKRRMERIGEDRTSLWYFNMLSFLDNIRPQLHTSRTAKTKRASTSGEKAPKMRRKRSSSDDNTIKFEVEKLDSECDEEGEYLDDPNNFDEPQVEDPFENTRKKSPEHVFFLEDGKTNASKSQVCKIKTETDEFESFANIIAISLRSLKHPQQTIAQKLISDVIFYSKLGTLTPDSTISNINAAGPSNYLHSTSFSNN